MGAMVLKEKLRRAGIDQAELAAATGTDKGNLCRMLQGKGKLRPKVAAAADELLRRRGADAALLWAFNVGEADPARLPTVVRRRLLGLLGDLLDSMEAPAPTEGP